MSSTKYTKASASAAARIMYLCALLSAVVCICTPAQASPVNLAERHVRQAPPLAMMPLGRFKRADPPVVLGAPAEQPVVPVPAAVPAPVPAPAPAPVLVPAPVAPVAAAAPITVAATAALPSARATATATSTATVAIARRPITVPPAASPTTVAPATSTIKTFAGVTTDFPNVRPLPVPPGAVIPSSDGAAFFVQPQQQRDAKANRSDAGEDAASTRARDARMIAFGAFAIMAALSL